MANITFFWDNEWDKVADVVARTEHANFPAENTQLRDFNHPWRSRYGAGSGWGRYYITTGSNDKLEFKDSGAVTRTAVIPQADYTADTLAAEIETQMEAVCADAFTVSYIEAGSDINKFKIRNETGNFELTFDVDDAPADSIHGTIGYDSENKTGAQEYIADNIRIHTYDSLKVDLGSAKNILAFLLRFHNYQAASTARIQGNASDVWGSPSINQEVTYNAGIMGYIWSSVQAYQWWHSVILDIDNAAGYVENGRIFLGPGFQPDLNYLSKSRITKKVDPSIVKRSEGGQISTVQLEDYEVWQYNFRVKGSTEIGYFNAMFDAVKKSKPLWICEDPDNFPAKTYYCQFVDWEWTPIYEESDYWELSIQIEELV